MKDQLRQEWVSLMHEGAHGQATRFRLRAMRLSQTIRSADPELAAALASGLSGTSALTRLAPTAEPADMPNLLSIEAEPVPAVTPHWPRVVTDQLRQIVYELQEHEKLTEAGLQPINTALLHGPPGVGKTGSVVDWDLKEPTEAQLTYAQVLATRAGISVPAEVRKSRYQAALFLETYSKRSASSREGTVDDDTRGTGAARADELIDSHAQSKKDT